MGWSEVSIMSVRREFVKLARIIHDHSAQKRSGHSQVLVF